MGKRKSSPRLATTSRNDVVCISMTKVSNPIHKISNDFPFFHKEIMRDALALCSGGKIKYTFSSLSFYGSM